MLAAIARNPAARPELLGKLAVDGSAMVRESAFSNPSTPTDALEKAAHELMDWKPTGKRHDWRKRSGLTAIHDNDSVSEELRDRIARRLLAEYGPDETPGELGVKARVDRFVRWQSSPDAGEMAHKIHADPSPPARITAIGTGMRTTLRSWSLQSPVTPSWDCRRSQRQTSRT